MRWIASQSPLVRDGSGRPLRMVGASTGVTQWVELLAAERRARSEAEAARRRMEVLAAAGERLARSPDPQATLEPVARTLVPDIADGCRIDLLDEHGVLQRKLAWHADPARSEEALAMARRLHAPADAVGSMVRTGTPHHGDDRAAQHDPATSGFTRAFGMHAHFVLPLVARGRTIGAMAVLQADSGRKLDEDDRALVLDLGRRAALALDNARPFADAEAARKQAEAASLAKDEFLALLGHELRNPPAPITTALQLMARRGRDRVVQHRQMIGRQVDPLSRLIDDLLDISRITRGKVQLHWQRVDLRAVVAHALELTRPVFAARPQPVQVQLPAAAAMVDGDFVRLSQVLCNLLVNAAKFTPPAGTVSLRLRERGGWEMEVSDTGCGIAPELLSRVFDLFVQGRQSMDRRTGGLGPGLTIVRNMVERHGGSVRAHSAGEGRGTTFTVSLPPSGSAPPPVPQPTPAPAPAAEHRGSGRILVVDDNTDAAQTLAELLQVIGYEARTAPDADAALQVLREFRPQLALLDIGLPQVDGYQLAGLIRQQPEGQGLTLVALTGYGQESDRARALAARFDEHLVKPVGIECLTEVLQRFL